MYAYNIVQYVTDVLASCLKRKKTDIFFSVIFLVQFFKSNLIKKHRLT